MTGVARRRVLFGITVVIGAACAGLATWQFRRHLARHRANAISLARRKLPLVDLNRQALHGDPGYRRVRLQGTYDTADVVIRGRLEMGIPGVHIATPLVRPGIDTAVMVLRGFVPAPDGVRPLETRDYHERGVVLVRGVALAMPDGLGEPIDFRGVVSWRRLDRSALAARLSRPLAPFYVVAEADSASSDHTMRGLVYPVRIEPPPLDDGPHLSYTIQWVLIGTTAVVFGIAFLRRQT